MHRSLEDFELSDLVLRSASDAVDGSHPPASRCHHGGFHEPPGNRSLNSHTKCNTGIIPVAETADS